MSLATDLTTIAENTPKVYEAGSKAYYDAFWDMFQDKGNRTDYRYAFYGAYTFNKFWGDEWLRPKYDIVSGATALWMFAYANAYSLMKGYDGAEPLGLDTSAVTNASYMFYNSHFRELPLIDLSNVIATNNTSATFSLSTYLTTLPLKVSENTIFNTTNNYNGTFYNCVSLENLTIEGTIGNDINFSTCIALSADTIYNQVIKNLKNYKDSGTTHTLTLGATNLAKLTDSQKAEATEKGWSLA